MAAKAAGRAVAVGETPWKQSKRDISKYLLKCGEDKDANALGRLVLCHSVVPKPH